jgi:UDP-N-acetylglucosamine/UDP-N-acetylgalactosamine diphosphorylase
LVNCQLGRNVALRGGFFENSVFLDGVTVAGGAHVRGSTVLEDGVGVAHTVGLKQTVLLPFVRVGSLVNFCDVLMAGGTSAEDHSEVGSSFVHFNFTPHRDKATASLVGDVPHGVLLRSAPIFLGGHGGIVGPVRIAFGTVVAAGGIVRTDLLEPGQLHVPEPARPRTVPFAAARSAGRVAQLAATCLTYLGNIRALAAWHAHVRVLFARDTFDTAVLAGAAAAFAAITAERVRQLELVAGPATGLGFEEPTPPPPAAVLVAVATAARAGRAYVDTVRDMRPEATTAATAWMQAIVDDVVATGLAALNLDVVVVDTASPDAKLLAA